ncbi:MAG: DNA polymerase III subunit beta [Terriglobia bacterium]
MEFTVEAPQFAAALEQIQGAVDRKHTIPVLSHCLIEAEEKGLQLVATDLEVGIRMLCPAQVKTAGSGAIPAQRLLDIVHSLGDIQVRLRRLENDWVRVTAARSVFKLAAMKQEVFPKFPAIPQPLASVPAGVLRGLIERTGFAVTQQEGRYTLNGALLVLKADRVEMVATDGSRLALASQEVTPDGLKDDERLLIPRRGLGLLERLTGALESEMPIAIAKDDNHLFFTAGDSLLVTRMIAGEFPKYEAVLPQSNGVSATLDAASFRDALERVSLLASEHHHGISLALEPGRITISATGGDTGEATESVDASWTGERFRIGFNCLFLQDFFSVVRRGEVEIALKDGETATEFHPVDNSEFHYRYVVAPLRA